ncbi:hypothetical protein E4U09_000471, partial [Claviceps aff. purpurea]
MTPTPAAKWTSTYSLGAQHALLKAANRVFDLDQVVESLDEFTDGLLLGQILHELDPEFEPSHLETTQGTPKYLTHKRNIQTIYKGLFRFIRRQVPELGCQAKKFDYHAVAENPEPQGISQDEELDDFVLDDFVLDDFVLDDFVLDDFVLDDFVLDDF